MLKTIRLRNGLLKNESVYQKLNKKTYLKSNKEFRSRLISDFTSRFKYAEIEIADTGLIKASLYGLNFCINSYQIRLGITAGFYPYPIECHFINDNKANLKFIIKNMDQFYQIDTFKYYDTDNGACFFVNYESLITILSDLPDSEKA